MKKSPKYFFNLTRVLLMTCLISGTMVLAQDVSGSGELMSRDKIEPQYKWNLEDIYKTEDDWKNDFNWLKEKADEYVSFQGKIGNSAGELLACLKFDDEVSIKLQRVTLYSNLAKDLDLSNAKYQSMNEEVSSLYTKISTASSFIRPEILTIPENKLAEFLKSNKDLTVYKQKLDDLFRMKAHTLPKEQEELVALASPVMQVPYNTFSMFENADIEFPKVEGEDGKEVHISHGRYYAALYSQDRDYRERVYRGFYKPFMHYKNTLVSLFNGNIKTNIFNAKARKYKSSRAAALDVNNIPLEVYDNLVKIVNENLEPLHRWAKVKKEYLKINDLHAYDTYVTLFPSKEDKYSYEEGKELTLKALKPLGDKYIADLKNAYNNRWIDVYETKGKRSGAYSSGSTYGVHPYVLLNWNDQLNDVFTLAHEMGHNMHSFYTGNTQPFPYADYSIFLAEIASTANEALLLDYLIEHAKDKQEKLALIEKYLSNITTTFYRQTRFAEFEQETNEITEEGKSLNSEDLCKMYGDMYQKYWGPEMVVDTEETFTWARIPHFYYNFYVFQYATGFAASAALVAKIKKEGQPAIDKYLNFLSSGESEYPIETLKKAGVDMTSPEPVLAVVKKMNDLLDQMEELLKSK